MLIAIWPPTRETCAPCVESLPVLGLCTLVLLRDSLMGPPLPRGEMAFPVLGMGAGLPLMGALAVSPLWVTLVVRAFHGGLGWFTLGLVIATEVVAVAAHRPGLRWVRIAGLLAVSVASTVAHLSSLAVPVTVSLPSWGGLAAAYLGLSRLAGPLRPERILLGERTTDRRRLPTYVLATTALAAALVGGVLLAGSMAEDRSVMDLPP